MSIRTKLLHLWGSHRDVVFVAEYEIPVASHLHLEGHRSYSGWIISQALQSPGRQRLITFWRDKASFDAAQHRMESTLPAVPPATSATPTWTGLQQSVSGSWASPWWGRAAALWTAVATVMLAWSYFRDARDTMLGYFALPTVAIVPTTESIDVLEGERFHVPFELRNGAEFVSLSASLGTPEWHTDHTVGTHKAAASSSVQIELRQRHFQRVAPGDARPFSISGVAGEPGEFFVKIAGTARSNRPFGERIAVGGNKVKVWPAMRIEEKARLLSASVKHCEAEYLVEAGEAYPNGVVIELVLTGDSQIQIEAAQHRYVRNFTRRQAGDAPDSELSKMVCEIGPLRPFKSFYLPVRFSRDQPLAGTEASIRNYWQNAADKLRFYYD